MQKQNCFPMLTAKNGFHILNLHPKIYIYIYKYLFLNANLLEKNPNIHLSHVKII